MQYANGVVDLRVADDAAAVAAAKRYLSYFRGPSTERAAARPGRAARRSSPRTQAHLRRPRACIDALFDEGSVLELRRGFGAGMVTALARVDGRPLGVVANDPTHLGGAIDADGADKAARFMQLCDAFDAAGPVPVRHARVHGRPRRPSAPRPSATSRGCSSTGANLTVPIGTIVLRKGYGLGAQAMAGGGFKAPLFMRRAGRPSEFGGDGAGGRRAARACAASSRRSPTPDERERAFEATVAAAYERGEGINMAAYGEIDDVIDPADTRRWIATLLHDHPGEWWTRPGKRRPNVDAW